MKYRGVFCLEGLWESNLKRPSTVRPILDLLRSRTGADYIYRDCATRPEFEYYLNKWCGKGYVKYPILYIASHGNEGAIDLGNDAITLCDLRNTLEGKCNNKVIIFGSCSVLDINVVNLRKFLVVTKAVAMYGYKNDVDWIDATAFELLLINAIRKNPLTKDGCDDVDALMKSVLKGFKEIDHRMVTRYDIKPWDDCSASYEELDICREKCGKYHHCPKAQRLVSKKAYKL